MKTLVIRKPDDFHAHLREGEMLRRVLSFTANVFARALVMPNLQNPLVSTFKVMEYSKQIDRECKKQGFNNFHALRTLYLTDNTTANDISWAYCWQNIVAVKLYPKGTTTGSVHGVSDVRLLAPVFAEMEKRGVVLSIHPEMPEMHSDYAEEEFLVGPFWWIYQNFPKLKIVWEHVTTAYIVNILKMYPERVAATITAHHLFLTRDDVLGNPHNYCKPPAKSEEDQVALINVAISGNPKFFFGSDSAPHWKYTKERTIKVPAGVFSAPVAIPVLAQVFEAVGALDKLENFVSRFGAEFYGLPLNQERICLLKEKWRVPLMLGEEMGNLIVSLAAGQELDWRVIGSTMPFERK
ncbi:MAG: dihydroorotase [Parcubacteria group bacterium CG10_big_fil_rev_8_21_14_0_10_36_14]|nr:MAG: dihydroorotase [Parcubacteria group bacterium CG10_big_fil_rev_8_21_14_0_10_36_14]